jgi:hypothetical protein
MLLLDITNFLGNNLRILIAQNLFFIGSYCLNVNVVHLFTLSKHKCNGHYLNMNVICLFILYRHRCYMSICIV